MPVTRGAGRFDASLPGLLLLAAFAVTAGLVYPRFSLNHDVSWYLSATGMFLDGARLYIDIIEINPPLAFYLTAPPVAAARLFGLDPSTSYIVYVVILAVASSLWVRSILQQADMSQRQRDAMLLAVMTVQFILPVADFGQREHLMLVFAMPFCTAQIFRARLRAFGGGYQIALALAAMPGLLLKPYFLAIPAALALMRLWQERRLSIVSDPAYLTILASALGYVAFIALIHPAYLAFIVPTAAQVYGAYGVDFRFVVVKSEIAASIVFALIAWRSSPRIDRSAQSLFAGCAGAAIAYLVQSKGWQYHVLPLSAFLVLTAVWLAVCLTQAARRDLGLIAAVLLVGVLTVGMQLVRGPYQSMTTAAFGRFVSGPGERILVLSTDVAAGFPFVNEVSGHWASRYPAQWLIPGPYDRLREAQCRRSVEACKPSRELLQWVRRSIVADLQTQQPDLVIIDELGTKRFMRSNGFDYLDYLAQDPQFRAIWRCYRRIGSASGHGAYRRTCRPATVQG